MKLIIPLLFIFLNASFSQQSHDPPKVNPRSSPDTIDQIRGIDPYNWLKNKSDTAVLNYVKAENVYTDQYFNKISKLRDSIYLVFRHQDSLMEEIRRLPEKKGSYYYFKTIPNGKKYCIHYRSKDTVSGKRDIVLDENSLAQNSENFSLSEIIPSPDDNLLAILYNYNGGRSILNIRDLQQKVTTDSIEDVESCAWSSNSKSLILTNSENQVVIHKVNHKSTGDKVIYTEEDDSFMIDVFPSSSGKFIFITSYNNETTEVRYISSDLSTTNPTLIQPSIENLRYFADHYGSNNFWILSRSSTAGDRILKVKISHPRIDHWEEVIRSQENINIITYDLINQQFLVLLEHNKLEQGIRVVHFHQSGDNI